jgi:ATP-dependent HslUV protease subunit HslV
MVVRPCLLLIIIYASAAHYSLFIAHLLMTRIRSTTVLGVRHNGQIALGADGQATMDKHVAKNNVRKVRQLNDGKVVTGFAGSTADAFMLLDRFEEKLGAYGNNLKRAAIELAKDWRKDQYLRKLEAMMVVADKDELLIVSGTGDVLEPDMDVAAIGSGAMYAQAAALALKKHAPHLTARQMVEDALHIAADICIYTNHNLIIAEPA